MVEYDYTLGGDDEDGGIEFAEPGSELSQAHIAWVRSHGVSPDWCFGIRLQGEEAVLKLARFERSDNGRWQRVVVNGEDGNAELVFDEHTVSREGFPEVPVNELVQQLSADKAALAENYAKARRLLDKVDTLMRKEWN